ncbi:TatD family hydrolase [Patescibacteria group bacterium]|nr:TatD family hydrolase [Patescibacteria group bacterium]
MQKLKYIDVHGHIQFSVFNKDREEVIDRARQSGVKMIAIGTKASTSKQAIEIAHQFPEDVWATVGFHPTEIKSEDFDIKVLKELATDPKVVAISECGFDLFRSGETKNIQEKVFLAQADLAVDLNKPLMMHCRPSKGTDDAYEYTLDILKDKKYENISKIMHFYAGSLDMAKRLNDLGFYFTFGGVITFTDAYEDIVRYLPLNRIFIETDCPYVTPKSHRGERNEPSYLPEIVQKLADIKGLDIKDVADKLYKNSVKVFNLK